MSDLDDVLVPRYGDTYIEEFRALALRYPLAAGFQYQRALAEFASPVEPANFSLSSMLESVRLYGDEPFMLASAGKTVVIPSRVQTIWVHVPGIVDEPFYRKDLAEWDNVMIHFRGYLGASRGKQSKGPKNIPIFRRQMTDILSDANSSRISDNFASLVSGRAAVEFGGLPHRLDYDAPMHRCIAKSFRALSGESCPAGPWKCTFPPLNGTKCAVATRTFRSQKIRPGLFVHHATRPSKLVTYEDGCAHQ